MKDNDSKKLFHSMITIFLVVILLTVGLYVATFWKYGLSNEHQAWANFGGYLGGILGPIISALAFYAVWETYKVQAKQLNISIKQLEDSKKDALVLELQKIMLTTTKEIKTLFNSEPIHSDISANTNFKDTLLSQLENLCAVQNTIANEEIINKIKSTIEIDVLRAKGKIDFICQVFEIYKMNGGEDSILLLYKKMIGTEVYYLSCAIPLTNSHISKFFTTIGNNN
ncbi:hypothetical protein ACEUDQ_20130 [Aeromonas caviae]|uniref:hypothetical protein n=1 Tax=Aeromonas caviae TaxID=648 RepID=UPI0038D0EE70